MTTSQNIRLKINPNAIVFAFFLLLSVLFWFLNALGKEYTTEISYPITFSNLPDNQAFLGNLPSSAKLKVSGFGFSLLQYKYSYTLVPFVVDMQANKPMHIKGKDKYSFFVRSQDLLQQFANHLGSELRLNTILTDTLFIKIDQLEQKKVPVLLNSKVTCKRQYMQINRPISVPDSVDVFGPRAILDTLRCVRTKPVNFPNVSTSFYKEIDLQSYEHVKFSNDKVKAFISVEKFTEDHKRLSIKVINQPKNGKLMIFPSDVTVYYIVSLKDYSLIRERQSNQFRAVVDYNSRSKNLPRMKVRITQFPASIRLSRQTPLFVSYIILNDKKKAEK